MKKQSVKRCAWSQGHPLLQSYHDKEWGVPLFQDRKLFEFLILDGAQAGLSWLTVLKKRKAYQQAYDRFVIKKVANYDLRKNGQLMANAGLIRNRLKINSSIANAGHVLAMQKEFGSFSHYLWSYVDYQPIQNRFRTIKEIPAKTDLSDAVCKDLKKRGFKFVGSKIVYAFLQSMGMVNDHEIGCFRYQDIKSMSKNISKPKKRI